MIRLLDKFVMTLGIAVWCLGLSVIALFIFDSVYASGLIGITTGLLFAYCFVVYVLEYD